MKKQKKINCNITEFFPKIFSILLLFISCVFYSQAFNGDNPDISIKNNATIYNNHRIYTSKELKLDSVTRKQEAAGFGKGELYISNNTEVCGISCFKNYKNYSAGLKNKNKSVRGERNPQVFANKSPLPKVKKIIIRTYRDLFIFSANGIGSDLMTLNNINNSNKSKIIKESIYFSPELLIYSEPFIFPYYSSKFASGLIFFAYSRPPPVV